MHSGRRAVACRPIAARGTTRSAIRIWLAADAQAKLLNVGFVREKHLAQIVTFGRISSDCLG